MNELFIKYQRPLLALANNKFGRMYLGIETDKKLLQLFPSSYTFQSKRKEYVSKFRNSPIYADKLKLAMNGIKLAGGLSAMELLHYFGLSQGGLLLPLIPLTTTTFNILGNSGRIFKTGTTWQTLHDAASGDGGNGTGGTFGRFCSDGTGGACEIDRSPNSFDTSTLPTNASPNTSSFLQFVSDGTASVNANSDSGVIVSETPASSGSTALSDWAQFGTVNFGSIPISSWVDTNLATNNINFNSIGAAAIAHDGASKTNLGVRNLTDINNSAPSGRNCVKFTGNTVVLSVTYTLSAAGGAAFLQNFI